MLGTISTAEDEISNGNNNMAKYFLAILLAFAAAGALLLFYFKKNKKYSLVVRLSNGDIKEIKAFSNLEDACNALLRHVYDEDEVALNILVPSRTEMEEEDGTIVDNSLLYFVSRDLHQEGIWYADDDECDVIADVIGYDVNMAFVEA